MANNFWFKFYFKEWSDDVKPLSLSARGLLIELIIHLRKVDGVMPIDIRLIVRLSGGLTEEINSALQEYREHCIFDFEFIDGVEYLTSRKIVKELAISLVNSENGKKGGNPKLKKSVKRIKSESVKPEVNQIYNSDFISESIFLSYCKDELLKEKYSAFEFSLKQKYAAWVAAGWKDGNDKPIKNWKTKIGNTIPFLKPMNDYNKPKQELANDTDLATSWES